MRTFRLIFYCFGITLLSFLQGCSVGNKYSAGKKAFDIGEYSRAIPLFKKAYLKEKNKYTKGEISFFLGESYRHINLPIRAASAYSKSVRYKYEVREAELYMAQSYLNAGKFDQAFKAFESYYDKFPLEKRARDGILSCKMAMNDSIKSPFVVEKMKMINSKYSDFCPVYAGKDFDQIYFTSMRTEKKKRKRNKITGQGGADIYFTHIDAKGKWSKPEAMKEPVNTEFDEGTGSITGDSKTMYFTRCRYEKDEDAEPEIYSMTRAGGKWSEPAVVQLGIDSVMMAHPAISPDGTTLYFVSDMPGGYGGKDIWKSTNSDGEWSTPVNLGSDINTAGDEMFPYVRSDGTLYFSSDSHVGFGGLDIYKAVPVETSIGNIWEITNLGPGINTFADDFGIVFKGTLNEGLLSSSRGSSRGIDNIFTFELPKVEFSLEGSVLSSKTNNPIPGAYVRLIGTDGTNIKLTIREDGEFSMKLKPAAEYVLLVAAKGFFNHKEKFSTEHLTESKVRAFI